MRPVPVKAVNPKFRDCVSNPLFAFGVLPLMEKKAGVTKKGSIFCYTDGEAELYVLAKSWKKIELAFGVT